MLIYYKEISIEEGFALIKLPKNERLLGGRTFHLPSGHALFTSLFDEGKELRCWDCGIEATRFVMNKGKNDHVRLPTLDLFAKKGHQYILMTRDHIIPRSWGGIDDIRNLRVGCSICNHSRGNTFNDEDRKFMDDHPELIHRHIDWVPPVEVQTVILTEEERLARNRARAKERRRKLKARRK